MGLCVSMLQRKKKDRHHEPRRGTPKALFVVRDERQPSKPRELVVQAQNPGGSGFQKPGKAQAHSRKHEERCYNCADVLGKRLCLPMLRLPCGSTKLLACGSTKSVAVEPVALERKESVFRTPTEGSRTPMTPWRTPVWQRRILMGTRCELPRFSGLILYDEHGRPLQSSTKDRSDHRKSESKGKKKTARTTTTLRDFL